MTIAYLLIVGIGLSILIRRGLSINVWWIGFLSTAVYSLPVAFGRDAFGKDIDPTTGTLMLLVLFSCLASAFFFHRRSRTHNAVEQSTPLDGFVVLLLVAVSLAAFIGLIASYGFQVFYVRKTESGISGLFYIVWRLTSTLAILSCLISGRYRLMLVAAVPLIATLFAGDRTAVGITLIASAWVLLRDRRIGVARTLSVCICVLGVGVFLFFGKTFQAQWASGTFTSIGDLAATVADQGVQAVVSTEPFATAGVMGALVAFDESPPTPLIIEVAAQALLVPSLFGFESSSFNDFYQPLLFPGFRPRSLAYSYWGEGYLRGGWLGFAAFLVMYLAVLGWFGRRARRGGVLMRTFAYVGGSYWAFYIHRNSLVSIIAYERQIVMFCVTVFILAIVWRSFDRRVRRLQAP